MNGNELACIAGIKDSPVYKYLMSISDHDITEIKYKYGVLYLHGCEQQSTHLDRDVYISYKIMSIFDVLTQSLMTAIKCRLPIVYIKYIFDRFYHTLPNKTCVTYSDIAHLRLYTRTENVSTNTIFVDSFPYFN